MISSNGIKICGNKIYINNMIISTQINSFMMIEAINKMVVINKTIEDINRTIEDINRTIEAISKTIEDTNKTIKTNINNHSITLTKKIFLSKKDNKTIKTMGEIMALITDKIVKKTIINIIIMDSIANRIMAEIFLIKETKDIKILSRICKETMKEEIIILTKMHRNNNQF